MVAARDAVLTGEAAAAAADDDGSAGVRCAVAMTEWGVLVPRDEAARLADLERPCFEWRAAEVI